MREIKFRAWGNHQNKYFNHDDVSISADSFITVFNTAGKHSKAVQPPGFLLSPWFIIEQYTYTLFPNLISWGLILILWKLPAISTKALSYFNVTKSLKIVTTIKET